MAGLIIILWIAIISGTLDQIKAINKIINRMISIMFIKKFFNHFKFFLYVLLWLTFYIFLIQLF